MGVARLIKFNILSCNFQSIRVRGQGHRWSCPISLYAPTFETQGNGALCSPAVWKPPARYGALQVPLFNPSGALGCRSTLLGRYVFLLHCICVPSPLVHRRRRHPGDIKNAPCPGRGHPAFVRTPDYHSECEGFSGSYGCVAGVSS